MTDPPGTRTPRLRNPLVPVVIGGAIGIVVVLSVVGDLGLLEIALIFLPMLVGAAAAVAFYLWAKRRGDR